MMLQDDFIGSCQAVRSLPTQENLTYSLNFHDGVLYPPNQIQLTMIKPQHSKEISLHESDYILQGQTEPSAPGMFEFDEIIHSTAYSLGEQRIIKEQHSRHVSNKQTAEFANGSIIGDQMKQMQGRIQSSTVSLLEQEVQRIRDDTLQRQSLHFHQNMHDLNYQRYILRGELDKLSGSQSATPSYNASQRTSQDLQSQPSRPFQENVDRGVKTIPDHALPSELLVCDTRIKRMKNLLIEAKKKIGPPLLITTSSSKNESIDQAPSVDNNKPLTLNGEQLNQWRTDLEIVRESLQKLSEEKLSAILQQQASPTFWTSSLAQECPEQQSLQTRDENARFDSDETYLAFLGGKPPKQSEDYPQISTPSSSSGYFANQQSYGAGVLIPGNYMEMQQFMGEQQRHRDESIERRVREAKVNLEWKIALKLKQRLQQNVVEEEKPASEEDEQAAKPQVTTQEKEDKNSISCVPSHIVQTLQKSRQNAIKRLNVLHHQHSQDGQVGLNSVDSLGRTLLSAAYSTVSHGNKFKSPNVQAKKLIPTSSIKLKRQVASTSTVSPSQTVSKQITVAGSNSCQGIILRLNTNAPSESKVFKISRPGSPDYAGESEKTNRKAPLDCWSKLAKPTKVVYKVQRTAVTSSERGDLQAREMATPVKKLTIDKLIKPPTGQRNINSPQKNVQQRGVFTSQRKITNLEDSDAKKRTIRVISQSQAHSRNQSQAPLKQSASENLKQRLSTQPQPRPQSQQRVGANASSIGAKSSPRSVQTRNSVGFGSKQPRTSAFFSLNRETEGPTKIKVRKSSPTHNQVQVVQTHQPRQTIFSDRKLLPTRTNQQRPALHPGTQILQQQQSNDWIRNCDSRIMRFIATSPSKNTKTRLLQSLSQQRIEPATSLIPLNSYKPEKAEATAQDLEKGVSNANAENLVVGDPQEEIQPEEQAYNGARQIEVAQVKPEPCEE